MQFNTFYLGTLCNLITLGHTMQSNMCDVQQVDNCLTVITRNIHVFNKFCLIEYVFLRHGLCVK